MTRLTANQKLANGAHKLVMQSNRYKYGSNAFFNAALKVARDAHKVSGRSGPGPSANDILNAAVRWALKYKI